MGIYVFINKTKHTTPDQDAERIVNKLLEKIKDSIK